LFSVRENNAQFVNGTVIDCKSRKPLANAALTVRDLRHPDRILGTYKADTAGRYAFLLHNSSHFKVSALMQEYEPGSRDYELALHAGTDTLKHDTICLQKLNYPEKEVNQLLKSLEQSSHIGNFAYKKAKLNNYTRENLDSLARLLKNYPDLVILVEGYTDGIGGTQYNLNLAQKRVDVCIRYLVSKGVPERQLQGKAMGECCPIAPEMIDGKDNPAGREMNRRVEYKVIAH
jgi:outer membrane protein OmpA-like peptidoglycan-associated protein